MNFEDQLRTDLRAIGMPEALAPASDLADTVLAGSRRQTHRRGLAATGVVIALAGAGVTAPFLLAPRPGPGSDPVTPACADALAPTTWETFDPLTYAIDATAVSGFEVTAEVTSTHFQIASLTNTAGDRNITVVLYAGGGQPHRYDGDETVPFDPAAGESAGEVRGAPAYWLPEPLFAGSEPGGGLAWQWTPGAWVLVGVQPNPDDSGNRPSTVDPAELRAIATEVAPALTLGTCRPVRSPFAMPVPDSTRLVMAAVMHQTAENGTPHGFFLLGFDSTDRPELTIPPANYEPSLGVFAETPVPARDDALTPYPDDLGFPAYVDDQGALTLYDVSGFAVNILAFDMPGPTTTEERTGLAADIFPTISFYPGAAESDSNWGDPIVP